MPWPPSSAGLSWIEPRGSAVQILSARPCGLQSLTEKKEDWHTPIRASAPASTGSASLVWAHQVKPAGPVQHCRPVAPGLQYAITSRVFYTRSSMRSRFTRWDETGCAGRCVACRGSACMDAAVPGDDAGGVGATAGAGRLKTTAVFRGGSLGRCRAGRDAARRVALGWV